MLFLLSGWMELSKVSTSLYPKNELVTLFIIDHGSRWAGQAITTDSRAVENAPPRVEGQEKTYAYEGNSEQEDFYESLENLEEHLAGVFQHNDDEL